MAEGTGIGESLSIWFFVGFVTLLYGAILLSYGAWAWAGNHEAPTVLHRLHPTFWWGLLLTLFGTFFSVRYRPRPGDRNKP